MAQTINLKKRLIGKEDINFDITGTGEVENIFTSDGNRKTLSKLNASHVPLLQGTRNKVNAVNVDDALNKLSDKIDNFEAQDVLTDDLVIEFLPEDDTETIQNTINQQKKNLNSHTLTFLFPSALQQNLYATLEWKDFYNGTVVIAGGSEDSKIAVYDRQDINSLFKIYRCQCEVRIEHFYFVHQYSSYAVSVESSSAVIFEKCLFSGMAKTDSYAVNKIAANAILVDCELNDDKEFFPEEQNGMGKSLGEIFAYPGAVPPEGAYLLNGQTIDGCNELYPRFWEWVQNSGVRLIDDATYDSELASAGVCGGFVINSANGSVRLPSVVNGTLWGADNSNIGQSLAAGLPNITGEWQAVHGKYTGGERYFDPQGAIEYIASENSHNGVEVRGTPGGDGASDRLGFNASLSNDAYGNSDTVQPPAIRVSWCIQVYNAATALSQQESAQLASLMQTKAQIDLANITDAGKNAIRKESAMRVWESDEQSIANSTLYQLTHDLDLTDAEIRKARARVLLRCVTPEHGYQVGDIISDFSDGITNQGNYTVTPTVRSNTIAFRKGPGSFILIPLSEAYWKYITNANWKMIFQIFY